MLLPSKSNILSVAMLCKAVAIAMESLRPKLLLDNLSFFKHLLCNITSANTSAASQWMLLPDTSRYLNRLICFRFQKLLLRH